MHLELNAVFLFGIITITMNATVRDYFCWFANLINCFVMSAEVGRGKGKVKRVDILVYQINKLPRCNNCNALLGTVFEWKSTVESGTN